MGPFQFVTMTKSSTQEMLIYFSYQPPDGDPIYVDGVELTKSK